MTAELGWLSSRNTGAARQNIQDNKRNEAIGPEEKPEEESIKHASTQRPVHRGDSHVFERRRVGQQRNASNDSVGTLDVLHVPFGTSAPFNAAFATATRPIHDRRDATYETD